MGKAVGPHEKKQDLGKFKLRAACMKPPSQVVLGSWVIVSLATWKLGEQGEQARRAP